MRLKRHFLAGSKLRAAGAGCVARAVPNGSTDWSAGRIYRHGKEGKERIGRRSPRRVSAASHVSDQPAVSERVSGTVSVQILLVGRPIDRQDGGMGRQGRAQVGGL